MAEEPMQLGIVVGRAYAHTDSRRADARNVVGWGYVCIWTGKDPVQGLRWVSDMPVQPAKGVLQGLRWVCNMHTWEDQHMATFASVEQLNGKNVGMLVHIRCKARPIKNAQPQLLASLQHKISRQPEDSTL